MQTSERLSLLIGEIYDAALNPARWPGALALAAAFVGGQAAGILSKDTISKVGNTHHHVGVAPAFIESYQATFWQFDPLGPLVLFDVGEVTGRQDYLSDAEFLESRFYREWCAPQGWIDSATVVLEKSAGSLAILSFLRGADEGLVDDAMRQAVRLVFPHFRRAVLIGKTIDLSAAGASDLAGALDQLSASVFLIDGHGRAMHANVAGRQLLSTRNVLVTVGGRLTATHSAADDALQAAMAAARDATRTLTDKGVALPLVGLDGGQFVAHILPLSAGARGAANFGHAASAALFVSEARLQKPTAPEVIASTFGLTPSELRVLLAVMDVEGSSEIAQRLGVSESTVHTHLRRLFEKTGTRRQADLVKIVAGFAAAPVR